MTANDMTVHIHRMAKYDPAAAERIRQAGMSAFRTWRDLCNHPAERQAVYLVAQEVQSIFELYHLNGKERGGNGAPS